jgi:hypothetical protein
MWNTGTKFRIKFLSKSTGYLSSVSREVYVREQCRLVPPGATYSQLTVLPRALPSFKLTLDSKQVAADVSERTHYH